MYVEKAWCRKPCERMVRVQQNCNAQVSTINTDPYPVGRFKENTGRMVAMSGVLLLTNLSMRGSYSGNTLAFQAKARSSILLPRSIMFDIYLSMIYNSEMKCDCDEIGRHSRLKIYRRKVYRFDSGQSYHNIVYSCQNVIGI